MICYIFNKKGKKKWEREKLLFFYILLITLITENYSFFFPSYIFIAHNKIMWVVWQYENNVAVSYNLTPQKKNVKEIVKMFHILYVCAFGANGIILKPGQSSHGSGP